MSRIAELLTEVEEKLVDVEEKTNTIARVIRLPMGRWDSTSSIMANMKRIVCVLTLWLRFRGLWVDYTRKLGTLTDYARDCIEPYTSFRNLRVATYGSGWNQGRYDAVGKSADDLVPQFPVVDDLKTAESLVRKTEVLAKYVDQLYRQSMELVAECPEYGDDVLVADKKGTELWRPIKKHLPIGGRLFYSVLKAVERGTLSKTMSDQNYLFGFCDDLEDFDKLLTRCQRTLRDEVEKKGKAPSWQGAIDAVPSSLPRQPNKGDLRYRLGRFSKSVLGDLDRTCSHRYVDSPTLYLIARDEGCKVQRMVDAIQGRVSDDNQRNNTPTVWLSRPERIGGDDYVVQGAWLHEERQGWNKPTIRKIVRGFVYFRSNWPDCFHSETELTERRASVELDRASEYYFRSQRIESERRLNARVKAARLLRKLRGLVSVCVDDSYATGNCKVGTSEFMNRLGIETSVRCVTGRRLAVLWRDAKFPQYDRFAGCVDAAEKRSKQVASEFYSWAMEG